MVTAPAFQLLERDQDLEILEAVLADARGGRGGLLAVEAAAGQGKTSLLRALRSRAGELGMRVVAATGGELERDFAFGVVRQLFEPVLSDDLLAGAAALAAPIFTADLIVEAADTSHARLHGLFWLCANLAEEQPLVVVVDDAHWSDAPSLRFIDVLARRVEDLPMVVAVGMRPAEPGAEQDLLDGLLAAPATHLIRPAPFSVHAIARLATDVLGREADPAFAAAAMESTRGNPLFVRELLRAAAEQGMTGGAEDAEALRWATPGTVTRMVAGRLRRLPPPARAVAGIVSVLGERSTMTNVADLSGLSRDDALAGREALVQAGLLEHGRLVFVHPIVREAMQSSLPAAEIHGWHRSAARLLADGGARDDEIATHLLACEPDGDEWAATVLAEAGGRGLGDGAPDVAARLLTRAEEEPPPVAQRPGILLELGTAEARIGDRDAMQHLDAARKLGTADVAARAARMIAYVTTALDQIPHGVAVLSETLRRDDLPAEERALLEDDFIHALWYSDAQHDEYEEAIERGVAAGRPGALAHRSGQRAFSGASRKVVIDLVGQAMADGRLLRSLGEESYAAFYAVEALRAVEAAHEADAALREAEAAVRRAGSPVMLAALAFMRPAWERSFGDLRRAENQLRDAYELFASANASAGIHVTAVNLALTLLDRGNVEEAEAVLAPLPEREQGLGVVGLHGARARAHAERGRWDAAIAEIERQYALERSRGHTLWPRSFLRVTHVRALLGTGEPTQAQRLAENEIALHAARDAPGHEAMARLSLALVLDGQERLAELNRAVGAAARSPMPIVEAQVLLEQGAALRRAGHRTDARKPLRLARDIARRIGATGLEERAHEELVIAGGRPQRVALAGVDSLTPSERRVADLAAEGLTNKEIAQALFVTLKTVEVHLGRAYSKLDIKGRSQLPLALAAG